MNVNVVARKDKRKWFACVCVCLYLQANYACGPAKAGITRRGSCNACVNVWCLMCTYICADCVIIMCCGRNPNLMLYDRIGAPPQEELCSINEMHAMHAMYAQHTQHTYITYVNNNKNNANVTRDMLLLLLLLRMVLMMCVVNESLRRLSAECTYACVHTNDVQCHD